jgi:hypothetical protein
MNRTRVWRNIYDTARPAPSNWDSLTHAYFALTNSSFFVKQVYYYLCVSNYILRILYVDETP